MLSVNLVNDFTRTHRMTGLLLLVSESLVVVLTVVRRRTVAIDRSVAAAIVTTVSLVGPSLVRTSAAGGLVPDSVTVVFSSIGLFIVIAGKITLGRSFGLVPANRGVVSSGVYRYVRHPIYAGYLLTHLAFACAHPTIWNWAVLIIADTALIVRAVRRARARDRRLVSVALSSAVEWHLVPGVF